MIETLDKYILNIDVDNLTDSVKLVGGGDEVPFFSETDRFLNYSEAADILHQNIKDSITIEPPYRHTAGKVYVYSDGGDVNKKDDWKADGYTWRNYGTKKYMCDGLEIEKTAFRIINNKKVSYEFQKHSFRFTDSYNGKTVIVYMGNSDAYKNMPHGNRKRNNRPHKRSKPSLMKTIKSQNDKAPKVVFDSMKSDNPNSLVNGISVPRNTRQIKNIQADIRRDCKLSHDSLYALHLLVDHLENYILSIKTAPDLEVIVGNNDVFEEFKRVLMLKDETVSIYYDTTFCLGDFYVSTLSFQHLMFKEKPIIPIAFMIHERKFQKCHEQLIDLVKSRVPKLNSKHVCIITDREVGIINAFKNILPNAQVLLCWNHIFRDLKFWLSKHNAKPDDKKAYDLNVRTLNCETREHFFEKFDQLKQKWSQPMLVYFEENLLEAILDHSGRWVLEKCDVYNLYSGITNNAAESINAKLKRLVEYRERQIDSIVLYLNYLQGNVVLELLKAFCGESEWSLLSRFSFAKQDPDSVEFPQNVCHPDNLIDLIKGKISTVISGKTESPTNLNSSSSSSSDLGELQPDSDSSKDTNENKHTLRDTTKGLSSSPVKLTSQHSLAAKAISDNGITLVPSMQSFMVKGSKDNKYSVTLFPKETCNCPSTTRCCHIIAAMMSIGMPISKEQKKLNLTQLRWNMRPKNSKRCGTKKGRKGDIDEDAIVPAPDSTMVQNESMFLATPANQSVREEINTSNKGKARKSLHFESTPKSILKKGKETCSNKKRKLLFRDKLSDQLAKIPKIDEAPITEEQCIHTESIHDDPPYDKNGTLINDSCSSIKNNILNDSQIKEEKDSLPEIIDRDYDKLLDNTPCPTSKIEEIIVLESSRSDELKDEDVNKYWVEDLHLTDEDKNDILDNKKYLQGTSMQ